MMKHIRVQSIALFLAGVTAAASQQVEPSASGVNNTLCSSVPFVTIGNDEAYIYPIHPTEDCLALTQVDKDNMIEHIRALNEVFLQSYAFYNIAKDPAASEPKDHQAELGYTLFNSPDEGVIDIDAEFKSIIQKVEKEGATLAAFWDIQSVANKLRDAHVTMPKINADALAGYVFFLPERVTGRAMKGKHSFSSDPLTGDLQLKIDWEDKNGTKSESVVESMNGMTPYEFFLEVSNSPSIVDIPYQSRGARFNSLLTNMRSWSDQFRRAFGEYNPVILPVYTDARPSDAYPPEVLVKYDDGSEEMYHAYLRLTIDNAILENLSEFINKQGNFYAQMMQALEGASSIVDVGRTMPQPRSKDVRLVRSGAESERFFDHFDQTCKKGEEDAKWALKFMDGYAILKMESFYGKHFNDCANSLLQDWKLLSQECKDRGIKKLIIDISNNGGGFGVLAHGLVTLMYPTAAHDWYKENLSLVINKSMQIYRDKIEPLLKNVTDFVQNNDEATDEALLTIMQGLTDSRLKQVNNAIDILKTFCDNIECVDTNSCSKNCDLLDKLQQEWTTFAAYKSPPLLKDVVESMVDLVKSFNRFSYLKDFEDVNVTAFQNVSQGGVETNLTGFFTLYPSNAYYMAATTSLQNNADFDEYILLSNGVAASAAIVFSSKVTQLWNNRDKTQVTAKLTTVSYGGLKEENGDVTMAGAAAAVEDIHLENEIIAAGVVYLFNHYILDVTDVFDAASSAFDEYYESLSKVPYFANSLPKMPLLGEYDTPFMGKDTIPLQYIKMPADEHIPTYYLGTKIEDSSDLGDLYEEAAKFFSAGAGSDSTPTPTNTVASDPTSTATTAARVGPFGFIVTAAGAATAAALSLLVV